jgi:hypothetical protein
MIREWVRIVFYVVLGGTLLCVSLPYHATAGQEFSVSLDVFLSGAMFYCAWLRWKERQKDDKNH